MGYDSIGLDVAAQSTTSCSTKSGSKPTGRQTIPVWTTQLSSFAIIDCLLGLPLPFLVVPLMEVLKSAGVLR